MNNFQRVGLFLFIAIIASKNVYAYIDPGTGSYFTQILIASLVGLPFLFSGYISKIKDKLVEKPPKTPEKLQ